MEKNDKKKVEFDLETPTAMFEYVSEFNIF
jgi:hypothetical protein